MTEDNLTAVQYAIDDLRLEQTPIPEIKDHQVLIKIEVVGICGSDVHYLKNGRIGPYVLTKPMICGHEASGTISKCGKDVKDLKPGDRVAIEPQWGCRKCLFCKTGKYNLCPDIFFCATPPDDGNLRRFYAHDADFCFKLPDNMDFSDGALMEPLAVGVHACNRANVKLGAICCVFGPGPIGLVTLSAAKAMGASKVVVVGRDVPEDAFRLQKAKEMGADFTIAETPQDNEQAVSEKIKAVLGGVQPDVSFDAAGSSQCVRTAVTVTKSGGVVVIIGMNDVEMTLPMGEAIFREVDIRGIFRYANCYPTAIEMVSSGKVNLKPMVTNHFKMEDTVEAFRTVSEKVGGPIKVHIHVNPNWNAGDGSTAPPPVAAPPADAPPAGAAPPPADVPPAGAAPPPAAAAAPSPAAPGGGKTCDSFPSRPCMPR